MHNYHLNHPVSRAYCPIKELPGYRSFYSANGWTDYWLGDHLVYSHRKNNYTFSTFPDKLHSHSFYELSLFHRGDISYIADDRSIQMQPCSLFIGRPGCIHTSRLLADTYYDRYIFYLDKHAFDFLGGSNLLSFLNSDVYCLTFPLELEDTIYDNLHRLDSILAEGKPETALLAYSYIIQFFHMINRFSINNSDVISTIPQNILQIKQYVDDNYLTLSTTTEIAEHFFYRREYVSRLFKEYFSTNLSDYLTTLKIQHSKQLLKSGATITDTCYQSGFHNMSTFTSAFRSQVHMNPSAYRKE